MAKTAQIKIDKFLGLHLDSTGDTGLKIGEMSRCDNIRITENYKARKRNGYEEEFNSIATDKPIRGMWYGRINSTYHFLFACNGYIYKKSTLSGTQYDSLDTASYTNVDVVKTTAIGAYASGTVNVDGATIVKNSSGTELTEIAQSAIDNVASVGKYYYHTDKSIWLVVAKGAYATIALARTGLGTSTIYYRLGALTDAVTTFFSFDSKVYIRNGTEYYSWNGTGAIATVSGYRPIVATATPPAGGGTLFEEVNVLTGAKAQLFSGDGASVAYYIAETAVTSIDYVKINGVTKTLTTDYTVDLTLGKVIPVAPATFASGTDNIEIGWTKGSGSRSLVTANKYFCFFGGSNDSRVFFYGDSTNTTVFSGLANGVPSVEYFPENNYNTIGTNEYPITYITKQFDRQIIFTTEGAYYSTYDYDNTLGANFPVYPLNDKIGNKPVGQGQLLLNNPFTVDSSGIYQWEQTNVRDEKNSKFMSERIQQELDDITASTIITFDYEKEAELWVCSSNKVYIYNYRRDVWYKFILADTPSCFIEIDNVLYMGTSQGQIMVFAEDVLTDNGTKIEAVMETGFLDFGENWIRKFLNFIWIGLQPESRVECKVGWQSDYTSSSQDETINYSLFSYDDIDYSNWSYEVNYNPQPFRLKPKAKKFTYFKLILSNDSTTDRMTILNITLPAILGGQSK